jgi:protein-disulfide isomerase
MRRFLPLAVSSLLRRSGLCLPAAFALCFLATSTSCPAQNAVQIQDASALHPPGDARVAIVEFDDMQCPACALANPTLKAAAAKYHIPWVRHDFLIPVHNWSRNAAIYARWFDAKNKALGDDYRDQVFANQSSIYNPDSLTQFTQKFAQSHGQALPFAIDPQGKLAKEVDTDVALARRMGLVQTPSIFIVKAGGKSASFMQVMNPSQQLYTDIDQAFASLGPAPPHTH